MNNTINHLEEGDFRFLFFGITFSALDFSYGFMLTHALSQLLGFIKWYQLEIIVSDFPISGRKQRELVRQLDVRVEQISVL